MPISCHFRDCKALLVTSLTHVSGAIASVQTFTFTFKVLKDCVAECMMYDTDSRYLGNEIRLRPLRDSTNNTVVIVDPLQTALADGVIDAWQMYSTAVSLYHAVYLQVAAHFTSLGNQLLKLAPR